jgi:U3 small nucleolar RNA-associated protein 15
MLKPAEFPKLKLKQYAKVQERETSEAKYWKTFSSTKEDTLQSSPSCIHFNPVDSSTYLVTGSTKVSLYDSLTDKVVRAYSRFNDDAYSGKFRKDGKLIVAGDKSSNVKVFDVQSKAVLREMKNHTAAVRCTTWASDGLRIFSGSDDKRGLCWDLATEQVLFSTKSHHTDYIRAMDASPISADTFVTGCYDHSVKMWDTRQSDGPVFSLHHDRPVEYTMFTPSGTMLLTASGSEVRVYDVISGGRLLHTFNNHQKYVTSLCMDGSSSRLLSAGLDGHIKVYSLQTLQVVHGMKFGSSLVSVAMPADNKKLVVGFVNGTVMARSRRVEDALLELGPGASAGQGVTAGLLAQHAAQQRHFKGAGLLHSYNNGAGSETASNAGAGADDAVVATERTARLQPYERLLKKFNYQAALDAALKTRNPVVVITVLEELCRRNGLSIALSGRDETTLEPIVSFSARYVNHPKYNRLVIQVVQKMLDLYASVLGHSDAIDELFLKLHKQVRAEVGFQRQILRVMGSLDGIVNAATMPRPTAADEEGKDCLLYA